MNYFLIAGEASGDLHGASLMGALKEIDTEARFMYFGGDLMQEQGGRLLRHYREMAFMGGIEVLMNVRKIKENFSLCRRELLNFKPDVLILIDYPGFNIKMAEFAHKHGIRVFWFIAPKVWAWKEWRIKKLKAFVNEMFTILPFETDYFARHQLKVHYAGNPLLDAIRSASEKFRDRNTFNNDNHLDDRPLIALLPGSRTQEVKYMLPVMTQLAADFKDYQFVISGTPWLDAGLYRKFSANADIPVVYDQTYELLHHAHTALVTSGTATLEAALLNVPQAVLYKMIGGKISYQIFRSLFLKVKYVSLPNLIMGRQIIREFIMDEMSYGTVKPELDKLLTDDTYRKDMLRSYAELRLRVGEPGAAKRAGYMMYSLLQSG
jgi:lipid-A-disaccharide synthase